MAASNIAGEGACGPRTLKKATAKGGCAKRVWRKGAQARVPVPHKIRNPGEALLLQEN